MPSTSKQLPLPLRMQRGLAPLLKPLGHAYAGLMRLRGEYYESGLLPRFRPECPCLSVGNIAWGGSGKTPLCQWLLRWAGQQGLRPVVLTRGYGAKPPRLPYVVREDSPPDQAGDEPLLLARECARSCPDGRVVVDPKRRRSGRWAWEQWRPDLFILDDGFQHLAVERHLDLVLLRPQDLLREWNRVIPAGSWREDARALSRASAFVLKMPPEEFEAARKVIEERLGPLHKPVFSFSLRPTAVRPVSGPGASGAPWPADKPYLLVAGVGEPAQVLTTAASFLGYPPEHHLFYPDHHPFSQGDARDILTAARRAGAAAVLCTPKDAVKLGRLDLPGLWTFDLDLAFGPSMFCGDPFASWLGDEVERAKIAVQAG